MANKDIIGAPVWEGIYPEYGIMVPCSWIYIGTLGKEQLVMMKKEDGFVRKFYRVRHSQGF